MEEWGDRASAGPSEVATTWLPSKGWRIGGLALVVVGIWLGLLADPVVGPAILTVAGLFAAVLAVLLVALGLGWAGFGLLALADRLAAWVRRASRWPES